LSSIKIKVLRDNYQVKPVEFQGDLIESVKVLKQLSLLFNSFDRTQ
jgi:hypothetical protein